MLGFPHNPANLHEKTSILAQLLYASGSRKYAVQSRFYTCFTTTQQCRMCQRLKPAVNRFGGRRHWWWDDRCYRNSFPLILEISREVKRRKNIPPSVYDKGMCPTMVIVQNMQTTDWFVSDPYWEFRYSLSQVRVLRFLTSFFEQFSILSSESNAGLHWFCLTVIGLENVCYSFYQSNT